MLVAHTLSDELVVRRRKSDHGLEYKDESKEHGSEEEIVCEIRDLIDVRARIILVVRTVVYPIDTADFNHL